MLKRYIGFGFESYYPGGGWNDFIGSFDSIEEAYAHSEVCQVVDLTVGEVVECVYVKPRQDLNG